MNRFDWNNFDEGFIGSIVYNNKTSNKHRPSRRIDDKDMLIPSIESIAAVPSIDFVATYRQEIEQKLLRKQEDTVRQIYQRLGYSKASNYLGMLKEMSGKTLGSRLATAYLHALRH